MVRWYTSPTERQLTTLPADAPYVKLTLYLVGEMDAERRRKLIASKLSGYKPCMILFFVASLASPVNKVELDAWASSAKPK